MRKEHPRAKMEEEAEQAEREESLKQRGLDGPTLAQLGGREDLAAQQHRVSIAQSVQRLDLEVAECARDPFLHRLRRRKSPLRQLRH